MAQSAKKPRESKPKVRSGCFTCKKRRVKCDETSPACNRCTKFGRTCAGYMSDREKESPPALKTRLAKGDRRALLPRTIQKVPIFPLEPTTQIFQNDQDYSFINLFCVQTSRELSGVFELPIWNRIVLQASHEHAYILDAIITIGNLSKSVKTALTNEQPTKSFDNSSVSNPLTERDFALWHYQRFLAGSRWAVMNGAQDTRMTLIVCLLVVCIETLQWNHHQALTHVWSGMDLLDEWLASRQDRHEALPGISSPEPRIIEDELFQQIRMLDAEAGILCDPRPREYHERLRHEGSSTVQTMPTRYTSMDESRLYLDLITRRTRHFISAVRPGKTGRSIIPSEVESPGLRTHFDEVEPFDGLYQSSACLLRRQQELYAFEIIRWSAAFEPLYAMVTPSEHEFLAFQLLKIRANVLTIQLYGEMATTEMEYDSFMPEFGRIVRLAKTFLNHPCMPTLLLEGSFNWNQGLIFPLLLVAAKCRDKSLRLQAIEMMSVRPWREGPWWSLSTAQLGAWLVGIE
ncbi:Beauvericin cluster-specific repressor, partial [Lachnellula subtilissima]